MATIPTAAPPAGTHQNNNQALTVLTSLFFMMGFITCMNDILVPHLKEVFSLNYAQALLGQGCRHQGGGVALLAQGGPQGQGLGGVVGGQGGQKLPALGGQ